VSILIIRWEVPSLKTIVPTRRIHFFFFFFFPKCEGKLKTFFSFKKPLKNKELLKIIFLKKIIFEKKKKKKKKKRDVFNFPCNFLTYTFVWDSEDRLRSK